LNEAPVFTSAGNCSAHGISTLQQCRPLASLPYLPVSMSFRSKMGVSSCVPSNKDGHVKLRVGKDTMHLPCEVLLAVHIVWVGESGLLLKALGDEHHGENKKTHLDNFEVLISNIPNLVLNFYSSLASSSCCSGGLDDVCLFLKTR
jgi:hypothetical protein